MSKGRQWRRMDQARVLSDKDVSTKSLTILQAWVPTAAGPRSQQYHISSLTRLHPLALLLFPLYSSNFSFSFYRFFVNHVMEMKNITYILLCFVSYSLFLLTDVLFPSHIPSLYTLLLVRLYLSTLALFIFKSLNFTNHVVALLLKIKVYIKFLFSFTNHALALFLKLQQKK